MKPECIEYEKNIARSLLGDLNPEESRLLESHLAACPDCRAERESYIRTLQQMQSVDDEPVPRHFFVYPEERNLNPWTLFRLMKPRWQAATAALAVLLLAAGVASAVSLSRSEIDVASLKQDILKTVERQNREARALWTEQMRSEIEHSSQNLTQQQKTELKAALTRVDSRFNQRLAASEGRARENTQQMASGLYRTVAQQRAQDLKIINLRFDSMDARNAVETRQTDAILGTLLQAAELRLK